MKKRSFENRLHRLWKIAKRDLDKVSRDTSVLVKKGEEYIKDKSEEGKRMLKLMALSLQKEGLYYELGKAVASSKRKGAYSKKTLSLLNKIRGINLSIKKTKK